MIFLPLSRNPPTRLTALNVTAIVVNIYGIVYVSNLPPNWSILSTSVIPNIIFVIFINGEWSEKLTPHIAWLPIHIHNANVASIPSLGIFDPNPIAVIDASA